MKKASLTILVTMAISLTMLAGCGGNTGTTNGGDNPPTGTTATNNPGTTSNETTGRLNPPTWLIGSWTRKDGTPGEDIDVTAHNVTVSSGNLDFSFQMSSLGLQVTEATDGGVYSLAYTTSGTDVKYAFEQMSDGKMQQTITMGGAALPFIYVKK